MKSEYTKGEWGITTENYYASKEDYQHSEPSERMVIKCGNRRICVLYDVKANARLIAQAPKLYEALKAIRAEGTRCLNIAQGKPVKAIYDVDWVDRLARQAIAPVESK